MKQLYLISYISYLFMACHLSASLPFEISNAASSFSVDRRKLMHAIERLQDPHTKLLDDPSAPYDKLNAYPVQYHLYKANCLKKSVQRNACLLSFWQQQLLRYQIYCHQQIALGEHISYSANLFYNVYEQFSRPHIGIAVSESGADRQENVGGLETSSTEDVATIVESCPQTFNMSAMADTQQDMVRRMNLGKYVFPIKNNKRSTKNSITTKHTRALQSKQDTIKFAAQQHQKQLLQILKQEENQAKKEKHRLAQIERQSKINAQKAIKFEQDKKQQQEEEQFLQGKIAENSKMYQECELMRLEDKLCKDLIAYEKKEFMKAVIRLRVQEARLEQQRAQEQLELEHSIKEAFREQKMHAIEQTDHSSLFDIIKLAIQKADMNYDDVRVNKLITDFIIDDAPQRAEKLYIILSKEDQYRQYDKQFFAEFVLKPIAEWAGGVLQKIDHNHNASCTQAQLAYFQKLYATVYTCVLELKYESNL